MQCEEVKFFLGSPAPVLNLISTGRLKYMLRSARAGLFPNCAEGAISSQSTLNLVHRNPHHQEKRHQILPILIRLCDARCIYVPLQLLKTSFFLSLMNQYAYLFRVKFIIQSKVSFYVLVTKELYTTRSTKIIQSSHHLLGNFLLNLSWNTNPFIYKLNANSNLTMTLKSSLSL